VVRVADRKGRGEEATGAFCPGPHHVKGPKLGPQL